MFKFIKKTRQTGAVLLIAALFSAILAGCTGNTKKTEGIVNPSFDESKALLTVGGESVQPENERLSLLPQLGLGLMLPEGWEAYTDNMTLVAVEQGLCIGFLPPSIVPEYEKMSEEELENFDFESLYARQLPLVKVFFASSEKSMDELKTENSQYQSLERLAALDGNVYYIACNTAAPKRENPWLTQSDIELFEKLSSAAGKLRNGIVIFPIQKAPWDDMIPEEELRALKAVDLNGNEVRAEIFADYDLTMINIWATWCGPCVQELPELAELHASLPKNVNLITICADGAEEAEAAKGMLLESGASFVTISGDESLRSGLLKNVAAYPTTIFVDRNGSVVGSSFPGAWSQEEYWEEIESRLETLK